MEFTITCPIDGPVAVSLEDIDTVVLREPESADITFQCPMCGESITVQAQIPQFLMAALEAMAAEDDGSGFPLANLIAMVSEAEAADGVDAAEHEADAVPLTIDPVADAYCEYFHRQLQSIECVEDFLAEVDAFRP